jgi:hypothetical protein
MAPYELFNKRYNIRNIINYNQILREIIERLINTEGFYIIDSI